MVKRIIKYLWHHSICNQGTLLSPARQFHDSNSQRKSDWIFWLKTYQWFKRMTVAEWYIRAIEEVIQIQFLQFYLSDNLMFIPPPTIIIMYFANTSVFKSILLPKLWFNINNISLDSMPLLVTNCKNFLKIQIIRHFCFLITMLLKKLRETAVSIFYEVIFGQMSFLLRRHSGQKDVAYLKWFCASFIHVFFHTILVWISTSPRNVDSPLYRHFCRLPGRSSSSFLNLRPPRRTRTSIRVNCPTECSMRGNCIERTRSCK